MTLIAIAMVAPLAAQNFTPKPGTARITSTVVDPNNDTVPGAAIVLEGPLLKNSRTALSDEHGFFEFDDLDPGTYTVSISATGFSNWTSPAITVKAGQYVILPSSKLKISEQLTSVSVVYSPVEVATKQVKIAEQQRVFGVIPNFYVVYDHDAAPLTTKLKFHLALRTAIDPITLIGIPVLAGINQAGDVPDYPQGFKGYVQRSGAVAADGFSSIMIGGAILPSLLHQDPRYFYQGTGSNKSRALHALSSPFICKGDNGRLQPNYSSMGGDLASAALSNAYYPKSNRGIGFTFGNLALSTGERMLGAVIQEFILRKLTPKHKN